ncbi:hypothetical protein HPB47_007049 [Ixodes persulcatus]|uniref:Uncharacterized protein n=1 Tax=Ixodes persulcatus TaxID=34615 RepID=A0AC60P8P0_IXOPE|nr:hypothetical protein HPB47_007049 [Ixodes persulcatus]
MKEANPLPNFLRVAGHRATFDYSGLKRVCRRCRQEGHVWAQCTTGYCDQLRAAPRAVDAAVEPMQLWTARPREATLPWSPETTPPISRPWTQETRPLPSPPRLRPYHPSAPLPLRHHLTPQPRAHPRLFRRRPHPPHLSQTRPARSDFSQSDGLCPSRRGCCRRHRLCSVSSDSDHLVIDENPAPGGPAATPTDGMDTTITDTPDSDSSRPPHEDSKRTFTSSAKQTEVMHFARMQNCDLLCLQDTNFARFRDVADFEARFSMTAFFSYTPRRATGVGVVVCNRSLLRNATYLFDTEGRTVRFDFFFGKRKFRLVTVYAPTVSTFQHDYFRSLDVHLLDAGPCFLVGDFNCVLDSYADVRCPGQGRSTWSARELRRLVRHFDLVDGWSLLHESTHQSTWNRGASERRIDRLYLPRTLSAALQTCTAVDFPSCPEEISDHRPLLIQFYFDSAVARSSRPWRLDSRILHDEATRRTLGNLVKESLVGVRPEPASWDRLKGQWQSFSTLMGRNLRERHRGLLQDTIVRIRIVRRGGALTPFMRAYLDQLQRRYERYLRLDSTASTVLQAQGIPSVHPEVLRYTHRTSLQAFERQQTPSASESPGRLDNGRVADHFRSLAQSDAPVDRTSVSSHPLVSGLPKISAEDDAGLRRPPSATELWNVLKRMKNGSAPGPDGLPAKFYRTFWHILGNFFTAVVRVYFEDLLLPPFFRLVRIVLIPKEGGDHADPAAWRPITLLNSDYKLLAATLASRLQAFLPELVNPRQTCSVSGRSIHTLTTLTRDILEFTRSRRANGLLVSLDQAKAFDRVEHQYFLGVLDGFGFSSESAQLFAALNSDLRSDLFLNGSLVARFPVTRGVRQGCPLSPVLFVLSLEPFLVGVDRHHSISGLALPGSDELRVSAYADDVTLYLRDEDSLVKAPRLFDEYACLYGARLNPEKSKSLCIGAPPTCPPSQSQSQSPSVFCGRLWHVARVALPPRPFILQVRSVLFSFFWNNRTELVRRSRLCLPRGEGGWSFPCIELAAPILALKTTLAILDDHDNPARPLTLYFLGANNRLLGDSLPSPCRPRAETTPAFYKSTADLFDKLSVHVSREEILEAPASRLVERLVDADQPPPPPGAVRPYPWLALTSSTLPDHVRNFEW